MASVLNCNQYVELSMKLQASLKKEIKSLQEQLEHLWTANQLGKARKLNFDTIKVEIELKKFHLPIEVGGKNVGSIHFEPVIIKTTGAQVDKTMGVALQPPYFATTEPIIVRMSYKYGGVPFTVEGKYSFSKSSVRKTGNFQQI